MYECNLNILKTKYVSLKKNVVVNLLQNTDGQLDNIF